MNTPIEKTQRRVASIQRTSQNDRWCRLLLVLFLLLVFGHTPHSAEGIEHADGIYLSGDHSFLGDSKIRTPRQSQTPSLCPSPPLAASEALAPSVVALHDPATV